VIEMNNIEDCVFKWQDVAQYYSSKIT